MPQVLDEKGAVKVRAGTELWILDGGVVFPALVKMEDGTPARGGVANLKAIIPEGTEITIAGTILVRKRKRHHQKAVGRKDWG
mgnify:CR=1 FL=1